MKNRTPISLFPFLSVLLSTMGVLSFLAVTLVLFSGSDTPLARPKQPVEVRWVGAPPHVRPLLVECRRGSVLIHDGPGGARFDRPALEREVAIVKELLAAASGELGPTPSETQRWFYFKTTLPQDPRLAASFTLWMHDLEIDNLTGKNRARLVERYPILLIYPDGVDTYDLASYLLEMTTRLAIGLEPMLPGWELPYQNLGS